MRHKPGVTPTGMTASFFLAFSSSKRGRHEVEEALFGF